LGRWRPFFERVGSPCFKEKLSKAFASIQIWSHQIGLGRKLTVCVIIAALLSAIATYAAWVGWSPLGTRVGSIVFFLQLDAILFLLVAAIVVARIVRIWIERRRGAIGSRLHTRLVLLFSVVATIPTIIVAISSSVVFTQGVEAWFNTVVRSALNESNEIANAYVEEHRRSLRDDILAVGNEFSRAARRISKNPEEIQPFLAAQAALRELDEAFVRNSEGRVFASWSSSGFVLFGDPVPGWAMQKIRRDNGGLIIFRTPSGDSIRGLMKLEPFLDAYLDVSRKVAQGVMNRVDRTRRAVERYKSLEGQRSQIEITLATMFIFLSLVLLLAAVWMGLVFASRLARPISELVNATEVVRAGDLSIRVDEVTAPDELGTLSRAFNRMAEQLGSQRQELVAANQQLDERRHFIETVLSGVSSAVVGLDRNGRINVINRAAGTLLFGENSNVINQRLSDLIDEFGQFFEKCISSNFQQVSGEITIDIGNGARSFSVRLSSDRGDFLGSGYVVTFDDVTELLAAQRKAAWSDVARRIAHEIKNPLTPIQLAAERLGKKYTPQIQKDLDVFKDCTETIVRRVSDIGRLVDEFSAFARLPAPIFKQEDLFSICRDALVLFEASHKSIEFVISCKQDLPPLDCDRQQISQVMINLIQNGVDSIDECKAELRAHAVEIILDEVKSGGIRVQVIDTGKGFPEDRKRLTEPYVTDKKKGTGLGLAIVNKIVEDHGGTLDLSGYPEQGAIVSIVFPKLASSKQVSSTSLKETKIRT
jgi:two-component system nitrogen regulation sensor histidine kinase NtrY